MELTYVIGIYDQWSNCIGGFYVESEKLQRFVSGALKDLPNNTLRIGTMDREFEIVPNGTLNEPCITKLGKYLED